MVGLKVCPSQIEQQPPSSVQQLQQGAQAILVLKGEKRWYLKSWIDAFAWQFQSAGTFLLIFMCSVRYRILKVSAPTEGEYAAAMWTSKVGCNWDQP